MKVNDFIRLYANGLDSVSTLPVHELEEITMQTLGLSSRGRLYAANTDIDEEAIVRIKEILKLRRENIPLQYATSSVNFFGLDFMVKEGVFIPRPETEVLIEYILDKLNGKKSINIVEIGTGSGIIAICLTKEMSECRIIATDVSWDSVSLARKNALRHNCGENILFLQSDLFDSLKQENKFDVLVSNPPYIGEGEFNSLPSDVKREPQRALLGGEKGVEFTLQFIERGVSFLKAGGLMVLEIGYKQRAFYEEYLNHKGYNVEFLKDFGSRDRVMSIMF